MNYRRIVDFLLIKFFAVISLFFLPASSFTFGMNSSRNDKLPAVVVDCCKKLGHNDKIKYLLIVDHSIDCKPSSAWAYFLKKREGKEWDLVFKDRAYVGKNGMGKTKEGDSKTPIGTFSIIGAFGILDNPGTKLPYIEIKETTYACDDKSEFYNKIIDIGETKHDCKGERMLDYELPYRYGLMINYNHKCEYGLGSNIFVHCYGKYEYTGGCIALSPGKMVKLLTTIMSKEEAKLVVTDSSNVISNS